MRLNHTTLTFPVVFASMLTFGLVFQVRAQQPAQPPPQYQGQSTQYQHFSRKLLESFIAATEEIQKIRTKYIKQRLADADSQAEQMKIREQAQTEMANAVHDEGLSVGTYNTIALAARTDPALGRRIQKILEQ